METFNRFTTDKPDESFNISKVISGRPITTSEVIELVNSFNGTEGRIGKLTGFVNRRFGSFYDAYLVFNKSGKCELDWGQNNKEDFDLKSLESLGCPGPGEIMILLACISLISSIDNSSFLITLKFELNCPTY